MIDTEAPIRRLLDLFNARALDEAAALFTDDALLEHGPTGRQQRGGAGYLDFARMWIGAFPDARLSIESITARGAGSPMTVEVDLLATGTHEGLLDLGGYGLFKPTGTHGGLHMRQTVELRGGRIAYSALSFDVHDIVQQLVTVNVPKLLDRLKRVQQLGDRLAQIPAEQVTERRSVIDRLGAELDAARRIVRPYFDR